MAELTNQSNGNSGRVRSLAAAPRVDLTAMVDLAFLLITFFMLTTTLAKQNGMDLAMPVGDEPQGISEMRTMTVCLGADNKILYYRGTLKNPLTAPSIINSGATEMRQLLIKNIKSVFAATGKGLIVLVKPSDKSNYGNLVNILDELKVASVPTYAIVDINSAEVGLLKSKQVY